jgi:arylsulfatase
MMEPDGGLMKSRSLVLSLTSLLLILFAIAGAFAQQVTGTPGAADATTTVNGKQLPPPPPKFGGVINESYKGAIESDC